MYDYLIVGAGLFGSTCANLLTQKGKKVLVIEKERFLGGNCHTEQIHNITIHKYGAHIFHTNNKKVWDYINGFDTMNNFINSPIAKYKKEIYNLPFNMNTFTKIWKVSSPDATRRLIEKQKKKVNINTLSNLEEQAISLVGKTIYKKLIKGYTEKQWGKKCKDLPPEIIKRLPVRFTYDNNYFNDKYQGIPEHGYTHIIERMLEGADIKLHCDYLKRKNKYNAIAKHIIYTGAIDEYYDYCFGELEYRSLEFKEKVYGTDNYQGVAVVNYTDKKVPYTRSIEHKHFDKNCNTDYTIVSYEYPIKWEVGKPRYYPINNEKNNALYEKYKKKAKEDNIIFGGRLGLYQYLDMDKTIEKAMELVNSLE